MSEIKFHLVLPDDKLKIQLIAKWYLSEWNIPEKALIEKIERLSSERYEFQILMTLDGLPVATGGLHSYVGLIDKEPRLRIYKNWLALVYTKPEYRRKGLGALICNYIQDQSKFLGLNEIYLYTHTAEKLYKSLGWEQIERIYIDGKDIVVMKKEL